MTKVRCELCKKDVAKLNSGKINMNLMQMLADHILAVHPDRATKQNIFTPDNHTQNMAL